MDKCSFFEYQHKFSSTRTLEKSTHAERSVNGKREQTVNSERTIVNAERTVSAR